MSDEPTYEWISTGGDALCDGMEGYYAGAEPPRPHPHCNCKIKFLSNSCYDIEFGDKSVSEKIGSEVVEFKIDYTIYCYNGQGISSTREDLRVYDLNRDFDEVWDDFLSWCDEQMQDIEIEAEEFCQCDQRVST